MDVLVRGDNGILGYLGGMQHPVGAEVRDPHHHSQAIHFLHHFDTKVRQAAAALATADTVAQHVAAIVRELHAAHAHPEEMPEHGQPPFRDVARLGIDLDGSAAFEVQEELHFAPIWRLRNIPLRLDDRGLAVGLLDADQQHVEHS